MSRGAANSGAGGQFVRFILVGLANTAFGYGVFVVFVLFGLSPQLALAGAFVLGVVWNFWAHARFVFGQGGLARFPFYVGVYVAIWALNAGALGMAERAGLGPILAQALLAPVAAVLSFFFIGRALTGRFPIFGKQP